MAANDPRHCSHAVLTLTQLVAPLTLQADVRPYLTVLNPDTAILQEQCLRGKVPSALIGVSNPLLVKNFQAFPCILHLDSLYFQQQNLKNPSSQPLSQQ